MILPNNILERMNPADRAKLGKGKFNDKRCVACACLYKPNNGSQKKCESCRFHPCPECGKPVRRGKFCGHSCATKANHPGLRSNSDSASVFWSKVDKRGELDCWDWLGSHSATGYGAFCYNGKFISTHRLSMLLSGIDPSGWVVCHRCDNRSCCNPSHLFLGSQKDNIVDASQKGRIAQGERSRFSKLNQRQAMEILALLRVGVSRKDIAKKFGVHTDTVRLIEIRKTWKHLHDTSK